MITNISISGFKGFVEPAEQIELSPFTFLVGQNASGKSNFLAALRFIRDSLKGNVEFAIGEIGGRSAVIPLNQNGNRSKKTSLRVEFHLDGYRKLSLPERDEKISIGEFDYLLEVDLSTGDGIPTIIREKLTGIVKDSSGHKKTFSLQRDRKTVKIIDPIAHEHDTEKENTFKVPDGERSRPAAAVTFYSLPAVLFREAVLGWSFYNISPFEARKSVQYTPDGALGPHGEGLPVMLHRLQRESDKGLLEAINTNLRGIIPGFESVEPIKTGDEGRWTFRIKEECFAKNLLPSSSSDGTIRLITLIVSALWSSRHGTLIAIEEPENGIHPHVHEHLVNLLRDTTKNIQLIATTHSPGILDHLKPEEVLLMSKINGKTKVKPARDVDDLDNFRKHFSLGDLFVQGTLDGVYE